MPHVILQPCGAGTPKSHYEATVETLVPLEAIQPHVSPEEYLSLQTINPDGTTAVWGVTSGKNDIIRKKWAKLDSGDVAFFSAGGLLFASGTITMKVHNKGLALSLWGANQAGQTWEYVYFLSEVRKIQIPQSDFNQVAEYKDNYVVQGFNVLDEEKSAAILDAFGLRSEVHFPKRVEPDYQKIVNELDQLDKEYQGLRRTEQGYLKKHLFGDHVTATCCICGKGFPIELLVVAHIKRRADCTDAERRMVDDIVQPMCTFGCDELFERGFVGVENGVVVRIKTPPVTKVVNDYIRKIEGNRCPAGLGGSKPFFEWHLNFHRAGLSGGSQRWLLAATNNSASFIWGGALYFTIDRRAQGEGFRYRRYLRDLITRGPNPETCADEITKIQRRAEVVRQKVKDGTWESNWEPRPDPQDSIDVEDIFEAYSDYLFMLQHLNPRSDFVSTIWLGTGANQGHPKI